MGSITVDDITLTPLSRFPLKEGDVLHGMKKNDVGFTGFGEAYFSFVHYRAIKAWKCHMKMTLNLVVPVGLVKFVFFDEKGGIREEVIGESNYVRLTVPPGIWFGFQGEASASSLLLNMADISHDLDEVVRKNLDEIDYDWEKKE